MQRVISSTQKTQPTKSHLAWRLITTLAAALTVLPSTLTTTRPRTAINEDKKMFTEVFIGQTALLRDGTAGEVIKVLGRNLVVIVYHDENGMPQTKNGYVIEIL